MPFCSITLYLAFESSNTSQPGKAEHFHGRFPDAPRTVYHYFKEIQYIFLTQDLAWQIKLCNYKKLDMLCV